MWSPIVATLPRYHGLPVPSTIRALVMRTSYFVAAGPRGTDAQAAVSVMTRAERTLVIRIDRVCVVVVARGPGLPRPKLPAGSLSCPWEFALGNLLRFLSQEVHQYELTQSHGIGEVRLAFADLRDALHEFDQRPVSRQHEGVDQDARAPAVGDFSERRRDDGAVQSHRVLV